MYEIRYIEDGHFKTVVGGPIGTLSEAIKQVRSLCDGNGNKELENYVGCSWVRGGNVTCVLLVCNELGIPIKSGK